MIGTIVLLAAALSAAADGVIGQSQPVNAEPLPFLTATVIGDGKGNVYLNGSWRIASGRTNPEKVARTFTHPLLSDGRDIYSHHRNDRGLWLVRATADGLVEERKVATLPGYEWALRFALAPHDCTIGFAARARIAVLDRTGRKVEGFSATGEPVGALADLSGLTEKSPLECVGFLAETGEILVGTGYPERKTHRFAADGREIVDVSWPCAAEAASYWYANGRTWALSCTVKEIALDAVKRQVIGTGTLHNYNSIVWTGKGYWLGTMRGAEYFAADELSVPARRLGGAGEVTTLALLDGRVFATVGSRICMYWLDDLPDEPMSSDDFQLWHLGGYRDGTVTGVAKRDGKLVYGFVPKGGSLETWQFDYRIFDWTHRADRLHRLDEPPPVNDPSAAIEDGWSVRYSPERKAILRRKAVAK